MGGVLTFVIKGYSPYTAPLLTQAYTLAETKKIKN